MKNYDIKSANSIIAYAKNLKNQTLREVCGDKVNHVNYKGKGKFGQFLEDCYFGYKPNSNKEPDFPEAGLELKASPLKALKRGGFGAKERLVLSIIDYFEVYKENFETSSFLKKNAHILLVFYLFDKELDVLDRVIKLVDDWQYPDDDWTIIKQDWEKINNLIKAGKAHELSEGDTLYLGACTKGSTAKKSFRLQPFNSLKAKQRAYSLKQGYVNHIIASISQNEKENYGKLLQTNSKNSRKNFEELIVDKFDGFYGKKTFEIEGLLGLEINNCVKSKNYYSSLTNHILGLKITQLAEEFAKAEIILKSIRVTSNNKIIESISFPAFKFTQIAEQSWDDSDLRSDIEKKFFFVFYKENNDTNYTLEKAIFWNMPYEDRLEAEKVWLKTQELILAGNIFDDYARDKEGKVRYSPKGHTIKKNNFPNAKDNRVCHVRPHGKDSKDVYPLPVVDKKLGEMEYSKQCFWVNNSYILNEIYLKYVSKSHLEYE